MIDGPTATKRIAAPSCHDHWMAPVGTISSPRPAAPTAQATPKTHWATRNSAQFQAGQKIARTELRSGDLVFFRTAGKRISHVGIYTGDGEFIHAPSSGKRVSISRLSEPYWARRFAGAKRPQVLAVLNSDDRRNQG